MSEQDDWMRNHVKRHRMIFLESLRPSAELFIEGFPGILDYQRDKINNLLRYSHYLTANGVLIDFIVRIDGFPRKFLNFCKTHDCNPELVRIMKQGLQEYRQTTGRRQQAIHNTSQTSGARNIRVSSATRSFQLDSDGHSSQNYDCRNLNSQISDEDHSAPDQTDTSSLVLVDKSRYLLQQLEELNIPADLSQVDSILQDVATLGSCSSTTTECPSCNGATASANQNSELLRCPCPYHEPEQNVLSSTDNSAYNSRDTSGSSTDNTELAIQQARKSNIDKKQPAMQQARKNSTGNKQPLTQHAGKRGEADKQPAVQQAKERNIDNKQSAAPEVAQNGLVPRSNSAVAQIQVQQEAEINNMNRNGLAQKRSCGNKMVFAHEAAGQEEDNECSFNDVNYQISQTITDVALTCTGEREKSSLTGMIASVQLEGANIQIQAEQPENNKCSTVNDYKEEGQCQSESSFYISSSEFLNSEEDSENSCVNKSFKNLSICPNNCGEKGEAVQANYQQTRRNFPAEIVCIKEVKCNHLSKAPPSALKKTQTSTTVQDIEDLKLGVSTSPEIEDLKLEKASLQEMEDLQFEKTVPKVINSDNLESTNLNEMKHDMLAVDTFQELSSILIQTTASTEMKSLQNEETSPKTVDSTMLLTITSLEDDNTKLEPCDKKDMGSTGFEITFKESEVCNLQFNMATSKETDSEPKRDKRVGAAPAIFVLVNAECSGTQCQEDRDKLQVANGEGGSGNDSLQKQRMKKVFNSPFDDGGTQYDDDNSKNDVVGEESHDGVTREESEAAADFSETQQNSLTQTVPRDESRDQNSLKETVTKDE